MRKHEHIIVYMKPVISMLLMVLAGCTDGRSSAAGAGASTENIGSSVVVDVKDFIENSGVKPMTPQLWIFDGTGEMISTEYGYLPGQPLNIEANKLGPGGQSIASLEKYLVTNGVELGDWKRCGADYCVVRLLPEETMGHCEYCDMTQSALDEFFSARNAKVAYHSIFLGSKDAAQAP